MRIDIWSDIACPFCYIGKAQFDLAVKDFAHRDKLEVVYHSFQLDPTLPRDYDGSVHDMLAKKLGKSTEEAKAMGDSISKQADTYGLAYDMDKLVITKTEDAHRLTHFAAANGKQDQMLARIYRAYFSEGRHVGDHQVLADIAAEVGLDKNQAIEVLQSDKYKDAVEADMAQAQQLGISGVPFYIVNQKYGLSGAQGEKAFADVLQKAWHEDHPLQMVGGADGATCTDNSCLPAEAAEI